MKLIISVLLLIFNLSLYSQSNQIIGDYNLTLGNEENHLIEYQLTLNQDGTFNFHSYSNNKKTTPQEVHTYGKGNWVVKDNVISFFTNKEKDFDEKYTLDFNNSKARFVTKNPRNKTDQIIKTKLQFFKSEIFWIEKIAIFKI